MTTLRFGPQLCTTLAESAAREWLVADGCGGYAMGTVAGLRTRRYHGLQVVSTGPIGRRNLGLAAFDPLVLAGDARTRLATHEWASRVVDPVGHELLSSFSIEDAVPRWRWTIGDVVVEREIAAAHGRPAVGVVHRVLRAPRPVCIELSVLCTWRDAHGERFGDGGPSQEDVDGGFVFEHAFRVRGPAWVAGGSWYRGARYREEEARGLPATEDLWCAGTFSAELAPGEAMTVESWSGDLADAPPGADRLVAAARERARTLAAACAPDDTSDELLALAADQMIVEGPAVVAGYPWFGEWSRDSLVSYEGLWLETGRAGEGRDLLERELSLLDEGMVPNTTDSGSPEYNTADATLWLFHAVERHVARAGDGDLAALAVPALERVVEAHVAGTRHGIAVDPADGLLAEGETGLALTWMDARVGGQPVTRRSGKAVEIEALWVNALGALAALQQRIGAAHDATERLRARAAGSFLRRFLSTGDVLDVVDGDRAESGRLRPNQLLAVSLPYGPLRGRPEARVVAAACGRDLLTPLGLRSLSPLDPAYRPYHRGDPTARDLAYHQGTVWPWLVGPYVGACIDAGIDAGVATGDVLDGLVGHLGDCGLGSVSETADGAPPHGATGCPFQAWSVAELLRARRLCRRLGTGNAVAPARSP